jgi:anti-sigma B factor antagonist
VEVTTELDDGVTVVTLNGDLDHVNAERVEETFRQLLAEGQHDVVVDLAGVTVVDGAGLATLVDFFKRVRIGPGDVRLCGGPAWVKVIFVMTRLNKVFDAYSDRAAAVASYR